MSNNYIMNSSKNKYYDFENHLDIYSNSNNKNITICELFEESANVYSDDIAVICNSYSITYMELNMKANQIANVLIEKGVVPDTIIGLVAKPSIDMLIGMIGILKAGCAYLPIDIDYPVERISYMIDDSEINILVSNINAYDKINAIFSEDIEILNLCIQKYDDSYISNPAKNLKSNNLAYVIYTSGSTGNPKGVMIEHKSVVNFFNGIAELIDFSAGKKILALTTISFDIVVLETLLALTRGLTVVLADENERNNPKQICELIKSNNIDMIQLVPSTMQLLVNYDKDLKCLKSLKEIMIGGEAFPLALLDKIKDCTKAKIYNMYGPTETTVWSTISDLTEKNCIDIGKPILNTQIYIVDKNNNLVPKGFEGELCIGGSGLARGYLKRPELTCERFIQNPFIPATRMYKTGDIARWLPDGNIECLGRVDNQVKIRGHRIELEEIETILLKYKYIKQVVVNVWQGEENAKYLCAYYISDEDILAEDLRGYLCGILPNYMVPACFIRLDNLPCTPNGKLDRNALPSPGSTLIFHQEQKVIKNEEKLDISDIESRIIKIIRDNINIPLLVGNIDLDSKLSDLGVDSITFIKIVVTIENEFEFEFEDEYLDANKISMVQSLVNYTKYRINQES